MNNCAKYQHPKKKFSIFLKNHKIAFFTFFKGLKMGPLKKFFLHFLPMFYTLDEQLYQICCTLDEISNISPQATDSPHPLKLKVDDYFLKIPKNGHNGFGSEK